MIFPEILTTYLPCKRKFELPFSIEKLDKSGMIKREESNGTNIFLDPLTKKIFFEKMDSEVFPLDLPIQVDIELTQRCNLRCKHCFIDSRAHSFSQKTIKAIKNLSDSGVMAFELIGGEPFLVKEIFEVIKYLKSRDKIVTVSTNGTLITEDLAKKIAQNMPSKIFVSIDGSRDVNDFIRGNGSFDKAINGIRNLNKYAISPTISFCVNKLNINSIERLTKDLSGLDIKSFFSILGEPPIQKSSFSKYFFAHSEREKVAERISSLSLPIKYTMHFEPREIDALYYGCFFRLTMCEMTPVGDILSCPITRKNEGNVLEEDLKIIWKRMQIDYLEKKLGKCKNCKWKAKCFPCEFDMNKN